MKSNHWSFATLLCLRFFLLAGLISGCGGSDTLTQTAVHGWVFASGPISGADLTFYDVRGEKIDETKKIATGKFGSFAVTVKNLPRDFRVVATGGSHEGTPSTAVLSADYRDFDTENAVVNINAVTTVVSAYLDKYPSKTLDEASKTVKSFLAIPDSVEIGSGLTRNNDFFSHSTFMEGALTSGGTKDYIAKLIAELDTVGSHPFLPPGPPPPQGAGSTIAMALASGAASYVGGEAMGWGLKETGLWNPDEDTERMQSTVVDISDKLTQLDTKLTQIFLSLSQQINESTYGLRVHQFDTLVSNITSIRKNFTIFVSAPPSQQNQESKRKDITDAIASKLLYNESIIPLQLREAVGAKSLLRLFSEIVKGQHRFADSSVTNDYIKAQYDYFNKLQEWLLLLQVEYYHAKDEGDGTGYLEEINKVINDYTTETENQQKLLKQPLPENTMVDTKTNMMFATGWTIPGVCTPAIPGIPQVCMPDQYFSYPVSMGREDFNKTIALMNSQNFAGFNNWRRPTRAEIRGFFDGHGDCSGSKGAQYLEAQGWPKLDNKELFFGSADYSCLVTPADDGWCMATYQTSACYQGGQIEVAFEDGTPFLNPNWKADWIPVRTMAENEMNKYFY